MLCRVGRAVRGWRGVRGVSSATGAPDEARQRVLKEFESRSADLEKTFGSSETGTPAEHVRH